MISNLNHKATLLTAAGAVLLSASLAQAQLAGNYTINGSAPTGGRNFKTFEDANKQSFIVGVSASVTFNVMLGTYNETILILPSGTSAQKTMTFRSLVPTPGSVKLQSKDDILIFMPGITKSLSISHITLDGLEFEKTTSFGRAIFGNEGNSFITIKNCVFRKEVQGFGFSQRFPSSSRRYIMVDGRGTATDWVLYNNSFDFHPGCTYGIYGSQIKRWKVSRNTFRMNGATVTPRTSGNTYGMYLINDNDARNKIFSNLFLGKTSTSSSVAVINMALSNLNNAVCGNTFNVEIPGSGHAVRTFGTSSNPPKATDRLNRFWSNIFNITGNGRGIWVHNAAFLERVQSDFNLFNIKSGIIGTWRNVTQTSLAAWQTATGGGKDGKQDLNSIVGDPQFVSATDLRLKPSSPALGKGLVGNVNDPDKFKLETDFNGLIRGSVVDMGAYESAGFELFGAGCPGTGKKVPSLGFTGDLAPGAKFAVTMVDGKALTSTIMALDAKRTTINFGGTCALLVTPTVTIGFTTTKAGALTLALQVPAALKPAGIQLHAQFGVVDAAATGGVAFSNGGTIHY